MNTTRGLIWIAFWAFVIVSWAAAGFYWFIAGWTSCQSIGSCATDGVIGVLTSFLMPIQVMLAVWLKQRHIRGHG
jgi:hypothetical protein